jgi:hypothetical protein
MQKMLINRAMAPHVAFSITLHIGKQRKWMERESAGSTRKPIARSNRCEIQVRTIGGVAKIPAALYIFWLRCLPNYEVNVVMAAVQSANSSGAFLQTTHFICIQVLENAGSPGGMKGNWAA